MLEKLLYAVIVISVKKILRGTIMQMQTAPKGLRLHIGIFGRRNSGKSSLLNSLVGQDVAIVSDVPGTTADPVEKPIEFLPLGPVLFIDTAGLDDDAETIGAMRADRSKRMIGRCDIAIITCSAGAWTHFDEDTLNELLKAKLPVIAVFTKSDEAMPNESLVKRLEDMKVKCVSVSNKTQSGMADLRELIIRTAPEDFLSSHKMLGDLTSPLKPVLLITPIDKEAPKGRMILPEVQAIRDTLDSDAYCVVVKENAVQTALDNLKTPPVLAVTDSQAFATVSQIVPDSIPLTSFSILLARMKGDLTTCVEGARKIAELEDGAKVLIAEACSHPPIGEDIGRVKIPKWMLLKTGKKIEFTVVQGHDFPKDPSPYDLVIHCGACMFNRREVLSRMLLCREKNVPFTNYGVAIAALNGILERAVKPFEMS